MDAAHDASTVTAAPSLFLLPEGRSLGVPEPETARNVTGFSATCSRCHVNLCGTYVCMCGKPVQSQSAAAANAGYCTSQDARHMHCLHRFSSHQMPSSSNDSLHNIMKCHGAA